MLHSFWFIWPPSPWCIKDDSEMNHPSCVWTECPPGRASGNGLFFSSLVALGMAGADLHVRLLTDSGAQRAATYLLTRLVPPSKFLFLPKIPLLWGAFEKKRRGESIKNANVFILFSPPTSLSTRLWLKSPYDYWYGASSYGALLLGREK